MKRFLFFIFVALLLLLLLTSCGQKQPLVIKDKDGVIVATLEEENFDNVDEKFVPYLKQVIEDCVKALDKDGKNPTNIKKSLFTDGYVVDTYLDRSVVDSMVEIYTSSEVNKFPAAFAMTNLKGGVVALYGSENDNTSYATEKLSPCSAFKPLAVYSIALENKKINWSTVFSDSPYKKITESDGNLRDWPSNASGVYSNKNVTVVQALRESLNTVAVRCLNETGVLNSIEFLEQNYGIDLSYEKNTALMLGEDEVIGNIALGSLNEGVTVCEMAAFYQVFANGGKYYTPTTVKTITKNKLVCNHVEDFRQVMSNETAKVMNELLQKTVEKGGTGQDAALDGIKIGGKTGTGLQNDSFWFVGFCPQYTLAVWHGGVVEKNQCPIIFHDIMAKMDLDKNAKYPSLDLKKAIYCNKSGLLADLNCLDTDVGLYLPDEAIKTCNQCN